MSDAGAPPGGGPIEGSEVVLLDDDWRQVEFVAADLAPAVDLEFADIQAIRQSHRVGPGFDQVHVRTLVADPLAGRVVSGAALTSRFGQLSRGLRVDVRDRRVGDGFVVALGASWALYGTYTDRLARILGLHRSSSEAATAAGDMEDRLRSLAREHQLLLVDWCRCRKAGSDDAGFATIMLRGE